MPALLIGSLITASQAAADWIPAASVKPSQSKALIYWDPTTLARTGETVEFDVLETVPPEIKAREADASIFAYRVDCAWGASGARWKADVLPDGTRSREAPAGGFGVWRFLFDDDAIATIARQACGASAPAGGQTIVAALEDAARRLGYANAAEAFTPRPVVPVIFAAPGTVETPIWAAGAGLSYDVAWSGPHRLVLTSPAAMFRDKKKDVVRGRSIWTTFEPNRYRASPAYAFRDFQADCRNKTLAIQTVRRWPIEISFEPPGPDLQPPTEPGAAVTPGSPGEAIWASACQKRPPLETVGDARAIVRKVEAAQAAAQPPS